ncbi:MAG: dihydroorotase [Clostridium sp.]|nr:dihydroorotase [Clostridium sp.]
MILIENGYVIDPKSGMEGNYDILIRGNQILRMEKKLRESLTSEELQLSRVIDAQGLLIAPGLVDVHVHFRDPGYTHKEDIYSGAAAAAAGGFTTVVMMANTAPVMDQPMMVQEMTYRVEKLPIHIKVCAAVSKGLRGEELTDQEALSQSGAIGFSDDGHAVMSKALLEEAMRHSAKLDMPISLHEEDASLIQENGIHHGPVSEHYEVFGAPREAESSLIARDLEMAKRLQATINIQHISTKEGVELVREAKKKNFRIHAEATPHHFSLTQDALIHYGSVAKVNPPLREESDRQAVIAGIVDKTIDIIATDHAPHAVDEKSLPLTEAPSGMIGLETALSLGMTELVNQGYLTMKSLLERMSTNPATMYRLDAGYLQEGGPADLILIDTAATWEPTDYRSKSSNTPFSGMSLQGKVRMTICRGVIIYQDET